MSQEIRYGYVGKIRIEVMKITGVNFNRIVTHILFSQLILVSRYIIHAGTNVNHNKHQACMSILAKYSKVCYCN